MIDHVTRIAGSVAFSAAVVFGAAGQSAEIPAPPQSGPIIVRNATIHPITSPTIDDDGYLVLVDGVITEVGSGEPPVIDGAQVFNANGLHIYPGLIGADTRMGLTETGAVDVTHDYSELGEFTPEVRAAVAMNPDSDLLPVTRANGILLALTFPSGGIISGRCSTVRLDGWTWEDMTIEGEAGLVLNWPRVDPTPQRFFRRGRSGGSGGRVEEQLAKIDRFFDDATAYLQAKASNPTHKTDLRFDAMRDTITGNQPIFVRADSAGQIESAIAWSTGRGYRIVIVGGRQADEALPILVKHDVPVVVGGTLRLPTRRDDAYDDPFAVPLKLYEAGVKFCIASGAQPAHERQLNQAAAMAAAYGLPREEAIRAVTQSAAEIIGVADRYGSLEVGKSATFILTTGDPLEITHDTLEAFVDGRRIDLGSRHKRLFAKYLEKYRQLGLIGQDTLAPPSTGSGSD